MFTYWYLIRIRILAVLLSLINTPFILMLFFHLKNVFIDRKAKSPRVPIKCA